MREIEPMLTKRQVKTIQRWLTLFGKDEIKPKKFVYFKMPRGWKLKTVWQDHQGFISDFELQMPYAPLVKLENGFKVVNSHLEYGQDFFEYEPENWDVIISNPPYKNKRTYWERCLSFGKPFTLLLPINILSDSIINATMKGREEEFQLIVPSRRTRFYNALTGEVGAQPTFKAAYFGVGIFNKQITLVDLPL